MMEKNKMGNERMFFRSPNINVCFKAGIRGNFSEDDFQRALSGAAIRHPALHRTVQVNESGDAWYQTDRGGISLEYDQDARASAWREWYEKTDAVPFDFERGPLVKVGVFCHEGIVDFVALGHHILGDGLGYLNLLKDFLSALDGRPDTAPRSLPERMSLKRKSKIGFLSGYIAKRLNEAWRKNARIFSVDEYVKFFHDYRRKNPPGMYLNGIEEGEVTKLQAACKKNRITINEAVAAAFVGALQRGDPRCAEKQVRLGCAASVRDEFDFSADGCMGNFVTGIAVMARYDNRKPFEENAKRIGSVLRKKLTNPKERYLALNFLDLLDKPFVESIFYAVYGDYDNPASKKLGEMLGERAGGKGIGISNLGRQETEKYRNFTIADVLFIPPAFPANLINVGVMTVNNRMDFCLRYAESDISGDMVERVYREARSSLEQL